MLLPLRPALLLLSLLEWDGVAAMRVLCSHWGAMTGNLRELRLPRRSQRAGVDWLRISACFPRLRALVTGPGRLPGGLAPLQLLWGQLEHVCAASVFLDADQRRQIAQLEVAPSLLRSLDLRFSFFELGDLGLLLRHLGHAPLLQDLAFSIVASSEERAATWAQAEEITGLLSALTQLRRLHVGGVHNVPLQQVVDDEILYRASIVGRYVAEGLSLLPLSSLSLRNHASSFDGFDVLVSSAALRDSLTHLDISYSFAPFRDDLCNLTSLESLSMGGTIVCGSFDPYQQTFVDDGAAATLGVCRVLCSPDLPRLTALNLHHSSWSALGVAALADGLAACVGLKRLQLGSSRLAAHWTARLAEQLGAHPSLQSLGLRDNGFAACEGLLQWLKTTRVPDIDLSSNALEKGRDLPRLLMAVAANRAIRRIDLSDNPDLLPFAERVRCVESSRGVQLPLGPRPPYVLGEGDDVQRI